MIMTIYGGGDAREAVDAGERSSRSRASWTIDSSSRSR